MRVLVIGKGGREHALAQKISESRQLEKIWVAPGNPGMQQSGFECVAVEKTFDVLSFCKSELVDLVVLGPEGAILSDLKQTLENAGISCLAPIPEAAQLESSKVFCKKILSSAQVKTAAFEIAKDLESAQSLIVKHNFSKPLVIKADGLAQGKGVAVCESAERAFPEAQSLSSAYGFPLLFEECLIGKELSAFALCDGEDFVMLGTACDYKRITANPFSANTGGMGAYSPCDFISEADEKEISEIFRKTLKALKRNDTPFVGFLFAGLMLTAEGLYVLEYNVRMGDPETQALLPRIESDFLDLAVKAVQGRLKNQKVEFLPQESVHVVAVSGGYPQSEMQLGHPIKVPEEMLENAQIYFAGVAKKNESLINSGGRVLGITALADNRAQAREVAYQMIRKVEFSGRYFREDIAL
ncbi:phosphoribosylamine--glycine ligase [Bdellovibrio sp. NC01]|uniref:phosphoribosylamine--glycine ligase n=1 Tax=Bdellovibrio sp. NC01 TaxID=2220073 RepID=UPI001156E9CA|nr:phosphoribosylamine--glycine ligase [Bdellovibrio sp. NC01]QDK38836.1 phosphoribosylamine--glycine ligase [Bdellovibrio sp. NC01]